ncbi:MAG: NAD(P)-binding domain-containing protein [Nitrospirae bacterium]|nr:NAD(P)-binding domain-containing protein [Nitrospirota bacterium]
MIDTIISPLVIAVAVGAYVAHQSKRSRKNLKKISKAREYGTHEPVHIHPLVDPGVCIGSGACATACPEKDILGLVNGRASLINSSHCIGHGACASACPVGAIKLVFGTETRGVDIPYVTPNFETNVKGVFIVGELGGMGLIKNAVTQGREVIEYMLCRLRSADKKRDDILDTVIIGAGPAGISASLAAVENNLRFVTLEQEDIGGTVLQYPRHKIVMTSPMDLPIYGKVKLGETSKKALLDLWMTVINKSELKIRTQEKMTDVKQDDDCFKVFTNKGEYVTRTIVLAIGRRGTPRKLGVQGEKLPKVAYRLLEPEQHRDQHLLVVGGGDSAVEAAIALSDQPGNVVTLSYRGDAFSRIKPMNKERLDKMIEKQSVEVILNSNVKEIGEKSVRIAIKDDVTDIPNDYVYIFAGGELPNEFLSKIGVRIEKRFGT